jgi:hypothetical protein
MATNYTYNALTVNQKINCQTCLQKTPNKSNRCGLSWDDANNKNNPRGCSVDRDCKKITGDKCWAAGSGWSNPICTVENPNTQANAQSEMYGYCPIAVPYLSPLGQVLDNTCRALGTPPKNCIAGFCTNQQTSPCAQYLKAATINMDGSEIIKKYPKNSAGIPEAGWTDTTRL